MRKAGVEYCQHSDIEMPSAQNLNLQLYICKFCFCFVLKLVFFFVHFQLYGFFFLCFKLSDPNADSVNPLLIFHFMHSMKFYFFFFSFYKLNIKKQRTHITTIFFNFLFVFIFFIAGFTTSTTDFHRFFHILYLFSDFILFIQLVWLVCLIRCKSIQMNCQCKLVAR